MSKQELFFTIYWLGGTRSIIKGSSIEQAFSAAGYGAGATKAIDFYDNGVSDSHYWDKETKSWVPYEAIHIHTNDVKNYTAQQIVELITKHKSVIVDFDNKDQYCIEERHGSFHEIGWLKYIQIVYAEYFEGSYSGNPEDGDHHYMTLNTEYHDPYQAEKAAEVFLARHATPCSASGKGMQLDEIKNNQHFYDTESIL